MSSENAVRRILSLMNYSGIDRIYQQFEYATGMILSFHRVSSEAIPAFSPNSYMSVDPDFLSDAIELLRRRGIEIVSIDMARRYILRPKPNFRFACLVFQRGYRDTFEQAYPVLKKHNVPFTQFVTTGLIEGTGHPWRLGLEALIRQQDRFLVQLPKGTMDFDCRTTDQKNSTYQTLVDYLFRDYREQDIEQKVREMCWLYKVDVDEIRRREIMTWQQIGELAIDSNCTLGASAIHDWTLSSLTEKEARFEIKESASLLEAETGLAPRHFSYPSQGAKAAGFREFELARKLGFKTAQTTRPGLLYPAHREHLHALPVLTMSGYYQRMRYLAPMTSGLPTRFMNRFRQLNVGD